MRRGKTRTLEVMKALLAMLTLAVLTAGAAFAEDPLCGNAPRCVGRLEYDSRLTDFHVRVLESMRIPYKLEKRDDQITVWWTPRSAAEEKEVDDRVSQYAAAIHECARNEWPTPSAPARPVFSCTSAKR